MNALEFTDKDKKRYIFSQENCASHLAKHPELGMDDFFDRIKETVSNPDIIYPAYGQTDRFCYYHEEFKVNGKSRYTKVVVQKMKREYRIITAFRPTSIRESKYFSKCKTRP